MKKPVGDVPDPEMGNLAGKVAAGTCGLKGRKADIQGEPPPLG